MFITILVFVAIFAIYYAWLWWMVKRAPLDTELWPNLKKKRKR